MKIQRALFFILAVCLIGVSFLFAQKTAKGSIESKIALESSLESRLKRILTEITGTDKIIVIVNVTLATEKKDGEGSKSEDDDFILPGVPIKDAISEKQVGDAVMAALGGDTQTLIHKLTATIILDKGVSASVEKVVKEVATGILGVDPERGDQLVIQKINFQKNPFYWGMLFYPPHIYWVLVILAALVFSTALTLFLFGPLKIFAGQFISGMMATAQAIKENANTEEESAFGGASVPDITLGVQQGVDTQKQKDSFGGKEPPFSFVNEGNIKSLIYLLKNEVPQSIASVINYLPPNLAVQVLNSLPSNIQAQIGTALSKVQELDPMDIDRLEAKLKNKIGFLSGGKDKIVNILDYASDEFKENVLNSIGAKDSSLSEEIKKALVTIDILSLLDVSGLQTLIKTVSPAIFSQVIRTLPENMRESILRTLPAGAASRIRQEIELTKPFSPQRLEIEKRRLIDIIRRLEARGLIARTKPEGSGDTGSEPPSLEQNGTSVVQPPAPQE